MSTNRTDFRTRTTVRTEPLSPTFNDQGPWVSDLHSSFGHGQCQSTVGFQDHPCAGSPAWYVELEILEYPVANPRWEGKLCNACLAGWEVWAVEEPAAIHVLSVNPIVSGE